MPYRPEYRQSWAIVVGVNAYTKLPPLQFAVSDARLLRDTLHTVCGFPEDNILLLEDDAATRDAILTNFRRTLTNPRERRAGPDDRVLFFFSGHGLTRAKFDGSQSGYLALAEAGGEDWGLCLSMDELLEEAQFTPAKHTLFLLDACFSGLALTRAASAERLAADLLTRHAVQALTAGMADQVVRDGEGPGGQNSPFTGYVVEGLQGRAAAPDGLLTASMLYHYVRERVGAEHRSIQTPHFGNVRGDGDMVFAWPRPARLPEDVLNLLKNASPRLRAAAVDELAVLLSGKDGAVAELARAELIRLREADPMPSVRAAAREALGEFVEEEAEKASRKKEAEERAEAQGREAAKQAELQRQREAANRAKREEEERQREELRAREEARLREHILQLTPDIALELARVPAGEFLMGSDKTKDKEAFDDEAPQHKLYLPDYLIGKTPVTVAQFAAFVKATKYKTTAEVEGSGYAWTGSQWEDVKGANWQNPRDPKSTVAQKMQHPVTLVSWHDALAFCEWASQLTHRAVRLPSEAEWEKAARGPDGRRWPWGNEAPTSAHCNFDMNIKDTTPVGRYSPKGDSPYGCLDMAGNVWEWTQSLWGPWNAKNSQSDLAYPYPYNAKDGRENLKADDDFARVLRGGSFYDDRRFVRCAYRNWNPPNNRRGSYGFRVWVLPSS